MAGLRDVDLNLLLLFQHLLEDRNISSVARRLDLSQPAVSNAPRRLRQAFGDELFVRTAQGMQPTPRAQQLAGPVSGRWRCWPGPCRIRTPSIRPPACGASAWP